jgi:hypothetical protein
VSKPRDMSMLERVRGGIGQLADPFTAGDLCKLFGFDGSNERSCVQSWLRYLEQQGELEVEHLTKRNVGGKIARYRRTKSFRAEPFNPVAQRLGGEFLQNLCCQWAGKRGPEQHAPD